MSEKYILTYPNSGRYYLYTFKDEPAGICFTRDIEKAALLTEENADKIIAEYPGLEKVNA